ncbi:MAG TPA: hypothetical protein VL381_02410 [Rhodocyclaceae bacterium]|jgi:hypothetical protein|nr:hypothetical protein [Rhodocyclaceae bacterium]
MMKKLVVIAGLSTVLFSGAAFAACSANNAAAGGFNAAQANTPGTFGTQAAPVTTADTCVCDGVAQKTQINGGAGLVVDPAVAQYIKTGYTITCSANSMVTQSDIDTSRFAIAGASRRGNLMHVGNSGTGSVRVEVQPGGARSCGASAADPLCTNTNLTAAIGRMAAEVQ